LKTKYTHYLFIALLCCCNAGSVAAQQITGVWKGRVKAANLELKIIKTGDSLTGTAYYYNNRNRFRRYSIKGYFDPASNDVIWWDDQLLEGSDASGREAALHVADFNCPGEDKMLLEGNSTERDNKDISKGKLLLQKVDRSSFADEWDWVIDNYIAGANHPHIIDSVERIAVTPPLYPEESVGLAASPVNALPAEAVPPPVVKAPPPSAPKTAGPAANASNQEKFSRRQNKLQMVIPVTAPFIELRFYDNAAIDGDSIALFLNGRVLREHILLGGEPQVIKILAADLQEDNELVLVAENLGSIPPNTSYLVAVVGHKQFEARLFADEGSSALIRFIKKPDNAP